jgi:hypothetical protein
VPEVVRSTRPVASSAGFHTLPRLRAGLSVMAMAKVEADARWIDAIPASRAGRDSNPRPED